MAHMLEQLSADIRHALKEDADRHPGWRGGPLEMPDGGAASIGPR